jgi:hypothetical protein
MPSGFLSVTDNGAGKEKRDKMNRKREREGGKKEERC